MNGNRFILQKYKGRSTRHECPQCHRPHCFTRYIDTEGVISFPDYVGRCDHENRCGYHYTPKQFFHDNPDAKKLLFDKDGGNFKSAKVSKVPHIREQELQEPKVEPYYFDQEFMRRTLGHYSMNNLYLFMARNFGRENTEEMFLGYGVGTAKLWHGATVFWQIDVNGRQRDGKIMMYDAESGHRSREERHHVNWLHSLMGIDKERIRQCFFGEHLIRKENNQTKKIAIVESEKTAIIASFYLPQLVWIAAGGKDGMLSQADLSIFNGREVIFFPDLGMASNWRKKAISWQRQGINVKVYDFIEQNASEVDTLDGLDIADYLLQEEPREYLLRTMMAQNVAVKSLVDKLGLEIVKEQ